MPRIPLGSGRGTLQPRVAPPVTPYQKLHNRMVVVTNKYAMMAPLRFMPLITPLSRTLTRISGRRKKKIKNGSSTLHQSVATHDELLPVPLVSSLTCPPRTPRALCCETPPAVVTRFFLPLSQASLSLARLLFLIFFKSGNHVADLFRY